MNTPEKLYDWVGNVSQSWPLPREGDTPSGNSTTTFRASGLISARELVKTKRLCFKIVNQPNMVAQIVEMLPEALSAAGVEDGPVSRTLQTHARGTGNAMSKYIVDTEASVQVVEHEYIRFINMVASEVEGMPNITSRTTSSALCVNVGVDIKMDYAFTVCQSDTCVVDSLKLPSAGRQQGVCRIRTQKPGCGDQALAGYFPLGARGGSAGMEI